MTAAQLGLVRVNGISLQIEECDDNDRGSISLSKHLFRQ